MKRLFLFLIICHFSLAFVPLFSKKAPLVISDESLQLKRKLKQICNKESSLLMIHYNVNDHSTENIKILLKHIFEIGLLQQYIRHHSIVPIMNIQSSSVKTMIDQYNQEAQYFNIVRAFLRSYEITNFKGYTKKIYTKMERMNRIVQKEKNINTIDELYFSSENILYDKQLKRKDSFHNLDFDTSRHLLVMEDIYAKKEVEYLKSIENPIGIRIEGRLRNSDIKKLIVQLNPSNEKGKLVLFLKFNKLQMLQRQIYFLLNDLNQTELDSIVFCHHISLSENVSSMKKSIDFFEKTTKEFKIYHGGFFMEANL